jgi:hypothetical protein
MLVTACENPVLGTNGGTNPTGNVIIKIAGPDGRTVLPKTPVFSKFELTLQKENEAPPLSPQVVEITSIPQEGVAVSLTEGRWAITLNAYQDVLQNGESVLAAKGGAAVDVQRGERSITVFITLNPLAMGDSGSGQGVFSYTITLPPDAGTATLSLNDSDGNAVGEYGALDLTIEENLSGSIALSAGYYDLSVIVTKNGQSAGIFESVHIYSGLESPLTLDLSGVAFADRIYITGTLGGIRLGTVKIADNAGGTSPIATLTLDGSAAVRSANWILDIPATYAGSTVYAVQEFNETTPSRSEVVKIADALPVNGVTGVALELIPAATPALFNVARWYSELTASGGEDSLAQVANNNLNNYWQSERGGDGSVWLEVDFGFDVTVNASRLIFYAAGSVLIDKYSIQYWNGSSEWISLVNRKQYFEGSTDGSVEYSNFFTQTINAQKFRWIVPGESVEDAPALVEFGLYNTPDHGALSAAIPLAQNNHNTTLVSAADGTDIQRISLWVTGNVKRTYQDAIHAAQEVCDNLFSTQQAIDNALTTLAAATTAFNNAKQLGNLDDIVVNEFNVQDGYAHKFVITWLREPTYIYRLKMSSTGNSGWNQIAEFAEWEDVAEAAMFTHEVTAGIGAGQTRYFTMQAFVINQSGGEVGGKNLAESGAKVTMGIPALTLVSNPGSSYRTISLSWTAAQMADAYRIVYSIAGDSTSHAKEVSISDLTPIEGGYTYLFQPNGYNNPQITGRKIDIKVEALNNALYEASGCDRSEITTTSNPVETRLVGPAELNAGATKATSVDTIELSWNPIAGANGYYVYRRQFNMNDTVQESAAIAYYVPAGSGTLTVTGKNIAAGNGDTTTVKATAAFAGGRFTLTDSCMTDAEYSSTTYSGYAANYKNQQNDLARGNAYRYFIVPVIAETDAISFTPSGNSVTYTLTDGSGAIAYSEAATLEKTGFTYGFAQNVTATKGTYASSGNVNDGIQITWEAPPLLAGTGVTPQYTLYRRAYNASTWLHESNFIEDTVFNDLAGEETARGIVYEYAVGINGSQPHTLGRFINDSRTPVDAKGIPNVYGYIQDMVKLQGVSRNEIKVGNEFGEDITVINGGIKNGGTDTNWGIDGYTVYVMNRNINGNWHIITDVAAATSTSATQVVRVTTGMGTADGRDLLRVMRDYRHYFKVRSYVLNNGVKVYCPDPVWNYETLFVANRTNQNAANFLEIEYVKWGARQITVEEFARIATLPIAWGIHHRNGTRSGWYLHGWGEYTMGGNNGSSGGVASESTNAALRWWWDFNDYKPDLDTRANKHPDGFAGFYEKNNNHGWNYEYSVIFLTIHTGSRGSNSMMFASAPVSWNYPNMYGVRNSYGTVPFDIKGPPNVNDMYTGKMRFDNFTLSGGAMVVKYPATAADVSVTNAYDNCPLPFTDFQEHTPYRMNLDAWY